ncbi:MAG: dienelactone hydrolase family protein [Ignavibacteriales bacterium]|nr:dienelactone hydrolase family protein [Ignavibacteriales bacterium]
METITSSLLHKIVYPGIANTGPHPAVILLHGRGTDENDLLGLASYLDPRLFIASVRAPFAFPFGGHTWYEIIEVGTPEQSQFEESYQRLLQFIGDLKQGYPVDPQRVFLLGFSMGSVMSFALSLSHPELLRGVIAHSGYIPEHMTNRFRLEAVNTLSLFVGHGSQDPVIPVSYGRRAKEFLSATKADLTYKEYPIPHTMSEESLTDLSLWLQQRLNPSSPPLDVPDKNR